MESDPSEPTTAKAHAAAIQIIGGVALGITPFLLGWFKLESQRYNSGLAELVGSVTIILATIVIALVLHGAVTVFLVRRSYKVAAISLWLVYPMLVPLIIGHGHYVEYRTSLAARDDHSGRGLVPPEGEIHDLLLVMSGQTYDGSGFRNGTLCPQPCISLLRAGVLESVAVPTVQHGGGFLVARHARGEVCEAAERNRSRRRELMRAHDPQTPLDHRLLEILAAPRIEPYGRPMLTVSGYLDECITTSFHKAFDYDVRITYGSDLRRPYGPEAAIAEIHGLRDGAPYRIARFEEGDGRRFTGEPFTIAEIITKLTDRSFDSTLAPYPVGSAEAELARLAALIDQGVYLERWRDLAGWINNVFELEARRLGVRAIELSAGSIETLIRIKQAGPYDPPGRFFGWIDRHLDQKSIDALIAADAAAHSTAQ